MPHGLKRYYGQRDLHFITFSCYRRLPLLTPRKRDQFIQVLEETRRKYVFAVLGFVVMPEQVHLLISEPEVGTPSTVVQVLKQRSAGRRKPRPSNQLTIFPPEQHSFWQVRFYDFNVFTNRKRVEKLRCSSFKTVCFAMPVMRQVAFIELPSIRAAITCARSAVLSRFIVLRITKV